MNDANLEVVNLNDLRLWQALDLVAVTFHDMRLTFCGSQILKPFHRLQNASKIRNCQKAANDKAYLSRAHITGADNVLHLARHEKISELLRQGSCALWDMDIADDEHELTDTVHRHCSSVYF